MHVNFCLPFLFGTKVTSRLPGRLEMTVVGILEAAITYGLGVAFSGHGPH